MFFIFNGVCLIWRFARFEDNIELLATGQFDAVRMMSPTVGSKGLDMNMAKVLEFASKMEIQSLELEVVLPSSV